MSKSTISTFELFQMFPDQESARLYLEPRLWPNGVTCPTCRKGERITTRKGGYYRCNACQLDFTVRTGTIFERSHIPLHKWLYAMYLLVTARKGISSLQLSKEIGVTQKSAWFMLQRLREACWDMWDNDDTDNSRYAIGNCFQTYKETQAYGERKTRIETAKANIDRWIIENEIELATGVYGYGVYWDTVQNKVLSWYKEPPYSHYADDIGLLKKSDAERLIAECAADLKIWLTGEV